MTRRSRRRRRRSRSRFAPLSRGGRRPRRRPGNVGAARLARELGGTERIVERYFLSLEPSELQPLLAYYEDRYGVEARRSTELILPHWRAGTIKISARMVRRLYRLLPPRMPAEAKYEVAERLWHHVGPRSRTTLRIGPDASTEEVLSAVDEHVDGVVTDYRIPEELQRRFRWLSAADVLAKQDLLIRRHELEKRLVLDAVRAQIPVALEHVRAAAGGPETCLAHAFSIGKHELELVIDQHASGVQTVEPIAFARLSKTWRKAGLTLRSMVVRASAGRPRTPDRRCPATGEPTPAP